METPELGFVDIPFALEEAGAEVRSDGVFRPRLEAVRHEGVRAYAHFVSALRSYATHDFEYDSERGRRVAPLIAGLPEASLIEGLPEATDELPLATLVSLAKEAQSGVLQQLLREREQPDNRTPGDEFLRRWLRDNGRLLGMLFPDIVQGERRRVWNRWDGNGRVVDVPLLAASIDGLASLEYIASWVPPARLSLLALIREGSRELADVFTKINRECLDRATDALVDGLAFFEDRKREPPDPTRVPFLIDVPLVELGKRERSLAGTAPTSAATILAALIELQPNQMRSTFGHAFTDQDVRTILNKPKVLAAPLGVDARPEARATRDFWTTKDSLGYQPFAEAIASFIRHRETRPPFTIGIKAPWGAGKTSLMRMVQNLLDPRADEAAWKPRAISLDPEARLKLVQLDATPSGAAPAGADELSLASLARRVRRLLRSLTSRVDWAAGTRLREATILDVLHAIGQPPARDRDVAATLEAIRPVVGESASEKAAWRPTVWFNPWMYQTGEQVWSGLAHEVIRQVGERLDPIDREWFWLQLNLRRVDRERLRHQIYASMLRRLIPGAIAATVFTLFSVSLYVAAGSHASLTWLSTLGALGTPLGPAAVLGWAALQVGRGLGLRVAAMFPELVSGPAVAHGAADLTTRAVDAAGSALEDPAYGTKTGYLYLIQTDVRRILDLIATSDQPLIVFVDDLDRCSPGTISQVIEAVNLFLAGEFPNCIFVLAMEPDIVAAHVEAQHEKLVARLGSGLLSEQWTTLGWRFLDKIVQLPLSIPEPDQNEKLKSFLDNLLGEVDDAGTRGPSAPASAHAMAGIGARGSEPAVAVPGTPLASGPGSVQRTGEQEGGAAGTPGGPDGPERRTPPVATPPPIDSARVDALVRLITTKTNELSIAGIRDAAAAAQTELLGGTRSELLPEAMLAARQVFERLLSERNPAVRKAIESGILLLGPRNPRQVKRFINLFRFYAFIEAVRAFSSSDDTATADLPAIAKLAAIAIRWPSLLTALTRRSSDSHTLTVLEGAAVGPGWADALVAAGLIRVAAKPDADVLKAESRRFDDLRLLLAGEPKVGDLCRRLL